jgi:hypothetical protein
MRSGWDAAWQYRWGNAIFATDVSNRNVTEWGTYRWELAAHPVKPAALNSRG